MTAAAEEKPAPRLYDVPAFARTGACSSCSAPIAWGLTDVGRRVPLSLASPFAERENGKVVRAPSHFTDCPHASRHSRRRQ